MNKFYTLATLLFISFSASESFAEKYLIDPSISTSNSQVSYKGYKFITGVTAFSSIEALNQSSPQPNSEVYITSGVFSTNVTITTDGLKFYGNNSYCDRTVPRSEESTITGLWNINANNIEINGFSVCDNGRIIAKSATKDAPLKGISIRYNKFFNSTVARNRSTPLIAIGKRYDDENANSDISQKQYKEITVSYNSFEGSASHIANAIGLAGLYGSNSVHNNYFYDGGTSIHIDNSQGILNINHNIFKNVGKTTSTAPDGGSKGDFCVYAMRCGYANSTEINITNNEFDSCYGQASYFSLLRIFQGDSNSNSCVTPVGMSVNVKNNTFKNKISKASNSNQLNENFILYSDKSTTSNINYNISDNHYDNRFYKYAWITLKDGAGQREIYSNAFDQFVFGGSYSTLGTSVIDNADISDHAKSVSLGAVTVLQSMDIDPVTGDMYFLQLMNAGDIPAFCSKHGLNASNCEPLILTKISCTKKATKTNGKFSYSTSVQKMRIAKTGHGVKLSVVRDHKGQLWMLTGGRGSDNGTGNDLSGKYISRFKFVNGKDLILDGSGITDADVLYFKHPASLNNSYASVDETSRYICLSSSGSGRQYYVYDLDEYLSGNAKPTLLKKAELQTGDKPVSDSGINNDNGFCTWSYQSFDINGDYLYFLEGESEATKKPITAGDPVIIISTYNWRTGEFIKRTRVNYNRINSTFGEPEAFSIRQDVFGNISAYLGIAVGNSGARKANVFKFHIDRHINSSGDVIGVDTATDAKHFDTKQYPKITMTASPSFCNMTSNDIETKPVEDIDITRGNSYLYGSWNGSLTGDDAKNFNVSISHNSPFDTGFTARITFIPDGIKREYKTTLRLYSPMANDILIPISANYTGELSVNSTESGINEIECETYKISISQTKSQITVLNEDIKQIEIYSIDGKLVDSIRSNTIKAPENKGVYILKAKSTEGNNFSTKFLCK